ncbi:DUF3253 domain-containing protein [Hwanghaeella sp.]|uniref:DUF3253 domain-containing protein n=1 Tax=Hwanghaeella sp. TaxID=2605943 RepID=UPI003CCBF49D
MSTDDDFKLDPVAVEILGYLRDVPANKPVSAEQVARSIADKAASRTAKEKPSPNAWRKYFQAVKNQAFHLARIGRIEITRKGAAVAPDDLKGLSGVWRMRLPGNTES